jgi:uncharacterized OB-fold protein
MNSTVENPTPPSPAKEYREALDRGSLTYQRCGACGHAWLPAREDCPNCWSAEWTREDASGEAVIISWVVFHTAFDARFKDRTPYNVTLVELVEGPRMVTNLIEIPAGEDIIGRRAALVFEEDMGRQLPRFRLTGD